VSYTITKLAVFISWSIRNYHAKKGVSALHNIAGNLVTNNFERATLLNDYFASVCTNDNGIIPPVNKQESATGYAPG